MPGTTNRWHAPNRGRSGPAKRLPGTASRRPPDLAPAYPLTPSHRAPSQPRAERRPRSSASFCASVQPDLRAHVALDRGGVGRPHALAKRPPGVGDRHMLAAPVVRAADALDEARLVEAVDEARGRVLRQEHVPLELEWPQPAFRRPSELEQRIIPGERREARGLQLGLDGIEQRARDAHEPRPGLDRRLRRVRACNHAEVVSLECKCIKIDIRAPLTLCRCICMKRSEPGA